MITVYWITTPYFTAACIVEHGRVQRAAPVLAWTRHKTVGVLEKHLERYANRKRNPWYWMKWNVRRSDLQAAVDLDQTPAFDT